MAKKNKKQESPKERDWMQYIIGVFLIGSLVLPILVLNESTMDPAYLIRHLILSTCVASIAFVLLLFKGERKNFEYLLLRTLRQPVSLAFLGFIGVKVVSTFIAINAVEAWFDILSSVSCFLFYLLLSALLKVRENSKQLLLWIIAVFNGLIIAFGVIGFAKVGFDWERMGDIGSQMVNPNLFAPLFFMCIPFLLTLIKENRSKFLVLVLLALDILIIIVLQNRATYLALLLGVIAFLGGYIYAHKGSLFKWSYLAVVIMIIIGSCIYISQKTEYLKILANKEADIHNNYNSTTERLQIWNRSILLFKDNPLIGVGTGNWPIRVTEYGITDPKSDQGNKYFLRPHNELLRILSELGILGFISTLLIVLFIVLNLIKLLRSEDHNTLGIALLSGFVGLIAFFGLSFPAERVPHMVLILGMVALFDTEAVEKKQAKKVVTLLLIGAMASFATYGFYLRMQNDALAKKMDDARNRKHWNKVIEYHEKIDEGIYNVNYFRVPIAFYSGLNYYHIGDIAGAKEEFASALLNNPNHILTLTNLATCYQQLNILDSAEFYFIRALQVNPNFEIAKQNLAIAYYNGGETLKAWKVLLECEKVPVPIKAAITRKYLIYQLENGVEASLEKSIRVAIDQEKWLLQVFHESKNGVDLEEILKDL